MKEIKYLFFAILFGLFAVACKPDSTPKKNKTATANQPATQAQQQTQQPAAQPSTQELPQQPDTYVPPPVDEPFVQQAPPAQAPSEPHAVLYSSFGTKQQAEDNIRILRANRVNCFIHETLAGQYGVLVGPFRNRNEANKQMSRLQERGIQNLSLYRMEN